MDLVQHGGTGVNGVSGLRRVVVMGVGNELLKDEGVGVHVVRALRQETPPGDISLDIIDGGTTPEAFLLVEAAHKLILVDAVSGGGEPGAVYRFGPDDIIASGKFAVSAHQVDLMMSLDMMKLSGSKPDEVVIIGIEPKEIDWGMELSPQLREKLPKILKVVMEELKSK
ncbi:HyaD/HybD family hydrogenase maturation endopeptidase [Chloroflexota bacterium]